jgi:hypothetical protein
MAKIGEVKRGKEGGEKRAITQQRERGSEREKGRKK